MKQKNWKSYEVTKAIPQKRKKTWGGKALAVMLAAVILSASFQLNIFALTETTDNLTQNSSEMVDTASPTEPAPTEPAPTEPAPVEPTPTEPTPAEPETAEPEATEPEATDPETTEPETAEPDATAPETTEPDATEPEATEPESNENEEADSSLNEAVAAIEPSLQASISYSLEPLADVDETNTITYYSNYPAASGISNTTYLDPKEYYENESAVAATLAITGFATPENYYLQGWSPSSSAATAFYKEGVDLGKIDVDWDLYAVWIPYKHMNWTINGGSYSSTYNAQSHTDLIAWPTAVSASYAGDTISGLTYQYSVNGGAFSLEKPSLVNSGNYTVTVKATAPRFVETTTTVNIVINKAPLLLLPSVFASNPYGSISTISYTLPAVNDISGPQSQIDADEINKVLATTTPLFDAVDANNLVVSNLALALPGDYIAQINSTALSNLQNNSAFSNYILSTDKANFTITELTGLTVSANALNTIYDAQPHPAVSGVTASVVDATIEYSINGSSFSEVLPVITNAGRYTVEIRATARGYATATTTVTSTIDKRPAVLSVFQYSKTIGDQDPAFSASFSGLQGKDSINYTLTRVGGEGVGRYAITADVAQNNNYTVTVNQGYLDILALPIVPETITPPSIIIPDDIVTTPAEDDEEVIPEDDTAEEDEDDTTNIEDESVPLDSQTEFEEVVDDELFNINDDDIPLATEKGSWALINLLLAIFTTILSVALFIGYVLGGRRKEEDDIVIKRRAIPRVLSIVVALVAIILFLLTQDMTLRMALVDSWSFWMAVIAVIQIAIYFVSSKKQYKRNNTKYQTTNE